MTGKFKDRKIATLFLSAVFGILLAILAYRGATEYLIDYGNGELGDYKFLDLCNVIFVSDDFRQYDYLFKDNLFLLLYPIMFFLGGIIICASEYLLKPKGYQSLVCGKSKSKKKAMKIIFGKKHMESMIYVVCYFLTIIILSYLFLPQLWKESAIGNLIIVRNLFGYAVVSFIYLMNFNAFVFFIYRWKNESYAFLSFFLMISFIFSLDMTSSSFSIILFNPVNNFMDNILIGCGLWFLFRYLEKNKIKFELLS